MCNKVIYNGRIFNGEMMIDGDGVYLKDGRISKILQKDEIEKYVNENAQMIDAQGHLIMPGMIDLQLNGCGGVLFNDEQSIRVLNTMNQTNVQYGCTGFLPTLITSNDDKIEGALACVQDAMNKGVAGVLGIHLEGPMISMIKKGIHQPQFIHILSQIMLEKVCGYRDIIKMMTIAPECVEASTLEILKNANIPLSIGHSYATYEECEMKGQYFTHATHLWNAMRAPEGREPGVVGYVLDHNQLFTGIIADGIHVHRAHIHLATKMLPETLYVTTDAVTPAGREDITSFVFEGKTIYVQNDKSCRNQDGQFGGANITMVESVQYLVDQVGVSLEQALKMATSIPARAISIEKQRGYIEENYFADVIILDVDNWNVQMTLQAGEIVYHKK